MKKIEHYRTEVDDKSKMFSWWRVMLSGGLAFILTTIGFSFTQADFPFLSTLIHAFVPMVTFTVVFTTMTNREKLISKSKLGCQFMWY
ncbi:hypothetical protein BCT42_23180 [Vibrio lentus]|nr:hypothetical protein BCU40_07625 [Vibrio lentus]PMN00432.1 hypothetical protein BCT42_23180 [Vibrio lentus]